MVILFLFYFDDFIDTEVGKKQEGNWRLIATSAVSKLESVCTNIQKGKITIAELESIKAKETQMDKLCDIISETRSAELQKSMTQRLREFEHFDSYKAKLEYFLSHIGDKRIGKE